MPDYRYIVLNSYPLSDAAVALARPGTTGKQAPRLPVFRNTASILAAQVLNLGLPAGEYVVVTRNPAHLIRFGLPVENWENINPSE